MNVQRSQVTKLVISGVERLDPVTVYAEDLAPARGRIVIECFGKSWSAYWGSMGDGETIASFVQGASADYIANCFEPGIPSTKYDPTQAADQLKKLVLARRMLHRDGRPRTNYDDEPLDRQEARLLWAEIDGECFYDDPHANHSLFTAALGEEWWHRLPEVPNPDYQNLCCIIRAVQQAFTLENHA